MRYCQVSQSNIYSIPDGKNNWNQKIAINDTFATFLTGFMLKLSLICKQKWVFFKITSKRYVLEKTFPFRADRNMMFLST